MATEKFETSLKKLEEIVHKLEGGSLSLGTPSRPLKKGSNIRLSVPKSWMKPSAGLRFC